MLGIVIILNSYNYLSFEMSFSKMSVYIRFITFPQRLRQFPNVFQPLLFDELRQLAQT